MKNSYYFLSENPVLLTVDGMYLGKVCAEPVRYSAGEGAKYISVQPLIPAIPYSFELTADNGNLITEFADVFSFPKNIFEVRLKHKVLRPYSPPKLIAQTLKSYKDGTVNFTIFADAYNQLLISFGTFSQSFILPDNLSDFKLTSEIAGGKIIAEVTAKSTAGQYIAVVSFDGAGAEKIIDASVHRIVREKNITRLYTARPDVALRAEVKAYKDADYKFVEVYYVYLNGSPVRTAAPQLIPAALFEAVKCGDYQEASHYLSPSLKSGLPKEKLEDFFAEYSEVAENKYFPEYRDCAVFLDKNGKATLFRIEIRDGKIENISEVD
jgi:hypothetical protein